MANRAPAYRAVYDRIRRDIHLGVLAPGHRLPATRRLAAELGLARGTVEAAYQMLSAEGYTEGRGAAGTRVAPGLRARDLAPATGQPGRPEASGAPASRALPFQLGLPALDAFPRKLWARTVAAAARALDDHDLAYPAPLGHQPLRRAIAAHVGLTRGLACSPDQVLITAGYLGALALVARVLLPPGAPAWVEDPGFHLTRELLRGSGAGPVAVPTDGSGISVEEGLRSAPTARLAVVTPTHQFPLGTVMTAARRLELLDWASATGAWILEDDYDSELHYRGPAAPALKSLDRADRVIHAGTFSKVLFPGLRIGFLVLPWALCERFAEAARHLATAPPAIGQRAVAAFLSAGHLSRHVARMRRLYAERREAMAGALHEAIGAPAAAGLGHGGLHVVVRLAAAVNDAAIVARCRAMGLAPGALSACCSPERPQNGLLLSFANSPAEAVAGQVGRLAEAMGASRR